MSEALHHPTARCAWCGSAETWFKWYACWEEDRFGNRETTHDFNGELTPREEIWYCERCEDDFIMPLVGEDYPTLPDDFIPPPMISP